MAIDRSLAPPPQRESRLGPDRTGVHFRLRLQYRNAPLGQATLDRPIERGRAAITRNARMHDQAGMTRPDRDGNRPLEKRCHDQIRHEPRHGLLGDGIGDVELDADLVAQRTQLAIQTLGQAVEAVRNE